MARHMIRIRRPQVSDTFVNDPAAVETSEVVETPEVVETDQMERRTWGAFSLAQVVHAICGVFLVVVGAIALGRAGFDNFGEDTTEVLDITATALLGVIAIGAGLLLMLAALSPAGRGFGGFIGVLLLVGGIVLAAGSDELLSDLHTESALGWVAIVVGAVAMVAALLPAHLFTRRTSVAVH